MLLSYVLVSADDKTLTTIHFLKSNVVMFLHSFISECLCSPFVFSSFLVLGSVPNGRLGSSFEVHLEPFFLFCFCCNLIGGRYSSALDQNRMTVAICICHFTLTLFVKCNNLCASSDMSGALFPQRLADTWWDSGEQNPTRMEIKTLKIKCTRYVIVFHQIHKSSSHCWCMNWCFEKNVEGCCAALHGAETETAVLSRMMIRRKLTWSPLESPNRMLV